MKCSIGDHLFEGSSNLQHRRLLPAMVVHPLSLAESMQVIHMTLLPTKQCNIAIRALSWYSWRQYLN
jgi:hypothetical protein